MSGRRGRPPKAPGERSEPASVRLPGDVYDAACREASRRRTSLSATLAEILTRVFRNEKSRIEGESV